MITQTLIQEVSQLEADLCFALSDPTRILLLYSLAERSRNVSELTTEIGCTQPTTSRHLKVLRERGLVSSARQRSTVIYSLSDQRLIEALDILRTILRDRISYRASLMDEMDERSEAYTLPVEKEIIINEPK